MRRSYVQINGTLYEKGTEPREVTHGAPTGPTILPDLPDFISPIDRSIVRGRAGIRDHCARHNVVPTAELAGLPISPPRQELSKSERLEDIRAAMIRKGYL